MPPTKRSGREDSVRGAGDKSAERTTVPSDSAEGADEIFDIDRVRRLVELMKEHDLNEVELRGGDRRIRLRRGPESSGQPYPRRLGACDIAKHGGRQRVESGFQRRRRGEAPAESASIAYIKSPMVGTFYSRPNPNSPPFVKPGDHINNDTTICIVEAMKVFNEIPAEARGRVVAVLVAEGEAVDHGKPLFKIDTAG